LHGPPVGGWSDARTAKRTLDDLDGLRAVPVLNATFLREHDLETERDGQPTLPTDRLTHATLLPRSSRLGVAPFELPGREAPDVDMVLVQAWIVPVMAELNLELHLVLRDG
jgi:hypothetical protein